MRYVAPEFNKTAFNCPHCNAYAHMDWTQLWIYGGAFTDICKADCSSCKKTSIWHGTLQKGQRGTQLLPTSSSAPMPNQDLPDDCRVDYLEARDIVAHSPRGAAALLRLVIQKLCMHLGFPGKNINDDIKALVRDRNLSEMVQQALDAIRVIGNNAVHPGELDLEDDEGTAITLFELVNIIVDEMISKPKKAKALFDRLPEGAKAAIVKRDQTQP